LKPRLTHYLIPLLASSAGVVAGKWISLQKNIFQALESKLGKWVHLAMGADNPSLILGALGLILGAVLVWGLSRKEPGKEEPKRDANKEPG
jgi:hypothetical protein